ncbi:unnamed protein product [Microthlaspi erraticum]|uniref:DUF7797 domain-containing protein n=1 Tax=Microthlaspi erraticum TaxID=1685480 RepID=A0A6D2JQ66_9BRAS|nr:unnamed protein product [Microthlaspi erraticum]
MVVVAASSVPMNLESLVNENGEETMAPPAKKQRFCDEMNRVAEIVLVLSALGRMRGGKNPSELEFELMVEARAYVGHGTCSSTIRIRRIPLQEEEKDAD